MAMVEAQEKKPISSLCEHPSVNKPHGHPEIRSQSGHLPWLVTCSGQVPGRRVLVWKEVQAMALLQAALCVHADRRTALLWLDQYCFVYDIFLPLELTT